MNSEVVRFAELDAQVVGISIDSIHSHIAFQKYETGTLRFPMGSDFFPHGDVAVQYGILRHGNPLPGISERAIFVIDKQGIIAFRKVYHLGEQPDLAEVFSVLQKLQQPKMKTGS
jgi:alkyl hydroperoxide reductase subunit AhpC